MPYGAAPNVHDNNSCSGLIEKPIPNVSYLDRKSHCEAMIIRFMTEHNLALSMSEHLIGLSQELSRYPKVLEQLNMDRVSATYKLTDGYAVLLKKRLVNQLKVSPFSITLDECFTKNNKKVLSVLVSFFPHNLMNVLCSIMFPIVMVIQFLIFK